MRRFFLQIQKFFSRKPKSFDQAIAFFLKKDHSSFFWGDRLLSLDKSLGFLSDPVFSESFKKIYGNHKYDQYESPHSVAWRLHTLCWAAQETLYLSGDLVECGTFKGDFAWVVNQVVKPGVLGKKFYLYDSFEGFAPSDQSVDPTYAEFANPIYRETGIFDSVKKRFVHDSHVIVTRGFLPEAVNKTSPNKVCFLHMDLNSPAAELSTLEYFWPRIVPGGIIIFDDYGWKTFSKQKDYEDRFAKDRGQSILELPTGQGLLLKRAMS